MKSFIFLFIAITLVVAVTSTEGAAVCGIVPLANGSKIDLRNKNPSGFFPKVVQIGNGGGTFEFTISLCNSQVTPPGGLHCSANSYLTQGDCTITFPTLRHAAGASDGVVINYGGSQAGTQGITWNATVFCFCSPEDEQLKVINNSYTVFQYGKLVNMYISVKSSDFCVAPPATTSAPTPTPPPPPPTTSASNKCPSVMFPNRSIIRFDKDPIFSGTYNQNGCGAGKFSWFSSLCDKNKLPPFAHPPAGGAFLLQGEQQSGIAFTSPPKITANINNVVMTFSSSHNGMFFTATLDCWCGNFADVEVVGRQYTCTQTSNNGFNLQWILRGRDFCINSGQKVEDERKEEILKNWKKRLF